MGIKKLPIIERFLFLDRNKFNPQLKMKNFLKMADSNSKGFLKKLIAA